MSSNNSEIRFVLPENPLPARLQLYRQKKKFTDVKVKIGSLEMDAHRIVLEDASPVIRAMLKHDGNILEFQQQVVDPEILKDLLDFFYIAQITITSENAFSLCLASHFLNISNLLEETEKFLSTQVCLENVIDFYIFSTEHELHNLKQSCARFFATENENVLENDKLLTLNFEEIEEILTEMKIGNENNETLREKMFKFVISWVENDSQSREPFLPNLFKLLPLHKFSLTFLRQHVSPHPLVNNSLPSLRILNEALNKIHSASHSENSSGFSHLFCLGGRDENGHALSSVSQLSTNNTEWRTLPQMSTPIAFFGATVIGKKIYVCGGYTGSAKLNLLEVFDCENNTWSKLAPMQNARDQFGITTLNGHIYVAGGGDNSNGRLSSVLKYTPQTNTWMEIKAMNEGREDHELVTLNGVIYAIAGFETKTVERYNPSTDEWIFVASTKHKHCYFGATSHQNKIYVLSNLGFEVFHPNSNNWQSLPKLNVGRGTQLVSINNKLWAVGGEANNILKASKTVYEFDTANNSWHKLPDMNVARKHHRAVVVNL